MGPFDAREPAPVPVDGNDADGVAIADEAYAFARHGDQTRPAPLAYRAPATVLRHVVASLAPGARYDVTVARDGDACRVSIAPGRARAASGAGVLSLELSAGGCALR